MLLLSSRSTKNTKPYEERLRLVCTNNLLPSPYPPVSGYGYRQPSQNTFVPSTPEIFNETINTSLQHALLSRVNETLRIAPPINVARTNPDNGHQNITPPTITANRRNRGRVQQSSSEPRSASPSPPDRPVSPDSSHDLGVDPQRPTMK